MSSTPAIVSGRAPARLRGRGDRFTLASIPADDATAPLAGGSTGPDATAADAGLSQGTSLGRYVVLGRLGAGGAGSVYAAYDTQIDRRVALKILHTHEDAEGWSARWDRIVREARLLGKLNHPNVVTIYDVAAADVGGEELGFIAMELVDGADLGHWLDATPRSVAQIVAVFLDAARGLQAAHAEGIVHGDFKPANVLVGDDGRARVSDFGVARLYADVTRDEPEGDATGPLQTGRSTMGHVAGTPYYMAPEQHDGRPPDARSDIYALCLTLHEALYGRRAFEATTYEGLALQKSEGPPPMESGERRVPPWLRRVLARGLDPDPGGRFADVAALVGALDRPASSRGAKMVAAVGFVGLTAAATVWLRPVPAQQARCEGAARHLEGVWDERVSHDVDAALRGTGLAYAGDVSDRTRATLDGYALAWTKAHTHACEATARGEQSEQMLDRRMQCLDDRRRSLSALAEVLADAPDDGVVRNAPDAARALPAIDPCDDLARLAAAPVQDPASAGVRDAIARAYAWADVGRYADAHKAAEAAQALAADDDDAALQAEVALAVGSMQARVGEHEAAAQTLQRAHFAAQRARADFTAAEAAVRLVAVVGDNLRRSEAGLLWGEHATAAIERAGGDAQLTTQLDTHLGTLYTHVPDLEAAEAAYRRAEAAEVAAHGEDAPELTVILNGLGSVAVARKDYAAAREHYQRALDIKRAHLGPGHPSLGTTWLNLGIAAKNLGQYEEARARYEAARDLWEAALGPDHPSLGTVHNNLGTLAAAQSEPAMAKAEYETACRIWEGALPPDHPDVSMCLMNLGATVRELGDLDRARELISRSLQLRRQRLGETHPFIAITHVNLGDVELEAHDPAAALVHFEAARDVWAQAHDPDHADHAYALTGIGRAHMDMGHPELGIAALERAVQLRDPETVEPRLAASSRFILARAMVQAGLDRAKAREVALDAKRLFETVDGTREPVDEVAQWLADNPA